MKKLLKRLLLVPIDLKYAVDVGLKLRQITINKRVYIFDFDNTLAGTAQLILERQTYTYSVSDLCLYESMRNFFLERQRRGSLCLVLSARPRKDRQEIIEKLKCEGVVAPVEVVSAHWLKAISLVVGCLFTPTKITLVDDMMRGEETGNPTSLFFPRYIVPKHIRLVTHQTVLRIR